MKNNNNQWKHRAAGILFTDGKDVLLLKRSANGNHKGQWCCPGGKLERGETFLGAAQRETKEEIGHLPNHKRIGQFEQKNGRYVFHTYVCAVSKKFSCTLSDEHDDWNWFPLEDLNKVNLHDGLVDFIQYIRKISKDQSKPLSKNEMTGFAKFLSLSEIAGATADLYAGYRKGKDYQVEGDPSSMIIPKKKKRNKRST